jgi:hypothetical protein
VKKKTLSKLDTGVYEKAMRLLHIFGTVKQLLAGGDSNYFRKAKSFAINILQFHNEISIIIFNSKCCFRGEKSECV